MLMVYLSVVMDNIPWTLLSDKFPPEGPRLLLLYPIDSSPPILGWWHENNGGSFRIVTQYVLQDDGSRRAFTSVCYWKYIKAWCTVDGPK